MPPAIVKIQYRGNGSRHAAFPYDRRMKSLVIGLAAVVAVLAGLFLLFRLTDKPAEIVLSRGATAVDLVIQQGRLVSGPGVIRVRQGDSLTLRIRCDLPEEFHLHGYDRKVMLDPATTATLQLIADHSGRFDFELEKSGTELGALEVAPR